MELNERKLPIGIQSFEEIRKNHYLYVDKTEYIWKMVNTGKVYFLSRPRRFGKSLLISTMEAYFQGKKGLFEGLAIEKKENKKGTDAWLSYPVIRFSLSGGSYHTKEGLGKTLLLTILEMEEKYMKEQKESINPDDLDLSNRFRYLIRRLYEITGRQVVVLVDEYDKPLLETMIVNNEQEEENRRLYKAFFGVLKDMDDCLKFVFFTGVTKFSKVSVFSDLNQLDDISLFDEYSAACGITETELRKNFRPEIENLAKKNGLSEEDCLKKLAYMYDGYHFAADVEGVYNPFSLLKALRQKNFGSYWFETGTPTFLIRKLEKSKFTVEQFAEGVPSKEAEMADYRVNNPNPIPLFYQSGYLTIYDYNERFRTYTLRFPNEEVKYGFLNSMLPEVLGERDAEDTTAVDDMIRYLETGMIDSFINRLEALFAGIPYIEGQQPVYEQEWRNEIYLVLALLGQNVKCEVHSSAGRADCVVETGQYVYIFEFKLDRSAEEALQQIEDRGYADVYKGDQRQIRKIGVNFSSKKRNVQNWKVR